MKIHIDYSASYAYTGPVTFSPHTLRLLPRQDHTLQIRRFSLTSNAQTDIQMRRDVFDNAIASCFLPGANPELHFRLNLELELREKNPFHFLLDSSATQVPFAYSADRRALLAPYLDTTGAPPPGSLEFWKPPTRRSPAPTVETLVELNRLVSEQIAYERRDEGEPRMPEETLRLGRGACRDTALLFAGILRSLGIACRLASGYLLEFDVNDDARRADGALHAWTEAFLPGAGWVGFDPTNGVLCNHTFIAAAVGITPADVSPVVGNYYSDHPVESQMTSSLEIEKLA